MPAIGAVTRQSFGTVGATLALVQFDLGLWRATHRYYWPRFEVVGFGEDTIS